MKTSCSRVIIVAAVLSIANVGTASAVDEMQWTLTPNETPVVIAAVTANEAPDLWLRAANDQSNPVLLAQATTRGATPAPSSRPSLMQKIGWGLIAATVVNLATGNIVGMAWTWHAALTAGGGYVGATTVANKMK